MQRPDFQTALVAVNAQYIHTGLGVRSIAAYVRRATAYQIDVMEFTINNPEQDVLAALYARRADAYLFSCSCGISSSSCARCAISACFTRRRTLVWAVRRFPTWPKLFWMLNRRWILS